MSDQDPKAPNLDDLFATARQERPHLSNTLMASILDDAASVQDALQANPLGASDPAETGFWRWLLATLGGGIGIGGVVTAGLAGVWIGLAPPEFLPDPLTVTSAWSADDEPFDSFDLSSMIGEDMQ